MAPRMEGLRYRWEIVFNGEPERSEWRIAGNTAANEVSNTD